MLAGAYFSVRRGQADEDSEEAEKTEQLDEQNLYDDIAVEAIELAIGVDLLPICGELDGLLMEKVKAFRRQYAIDMGFVFPSVRLVGESALGRDTYEVLIHGSRVASGSIRLNAMLAISAAQPSATLPGEPTTDPTYGLPATWIAEADVPRAREAGCTIVDPVTVIFTHFSETVRRHARELLNRPETEQILQRVRQEQSSLYEELVPNVLTLGEIQKVLQGLLAEKVSVRNIGLIAETLAEKGRHTKDSEDLTESVRRALGRPICENLADGDGQLKVMTLDPAIEHVLQLGLRAADSQVTMMIDPRTSEQLLTELGKQGEQMMLENLQPVLLCSGTLRRHIKRLLDRVLPHLTVLALDEVPASTSIASWGVIRIDRGLLTRDRVASTAERDANEGQSPLNPSLGVPT